MRDKQTGNKETTDAEKHRLWQASEMIKEFEQTRKEREKV